jgi:hypothetical protein
MQNAFFDALWVRDFIFNCQKLDLVNYFSHHILRFLYYIGYSHYTLDDFFLVFQYFLAVSEKASTSAHTKVEF